ncbi:hypothetical protein T265_10443 [Opisthorchis viverrini]|uniref:Uncharacterized protein n=1 Tax=Opisthorchis viverrini TaxID=6198 RepID=A0A074ZDA4_OPIVI|nr:hypothetical protein T265_10443 [Opisthorchis viverrini]KER21165.1 hypothetical protein T265_10443 [Opisthorchis viverrini]
MCVHHAVTTRFPSEWTADRHSHGPSLINQGNSSGLHMDSSVVGSDNLVASRLTSISHERLLNRLDRPQSSSFFPRQEGHIFTAASGLHRHATSRIDEEQEAVSSTSEIEDMCIDNSSEDSLNGAPHLNGTSGLVQYPNAVGSAPSPKVTSNNSHCRLRTALLTSSKRLTSQPVIDRPSAESAVQIDQTSSVPAHRPSLIAPIIISEDQSSALVTTAAVGLSVRQPLCQTSEAYVRSSTFEEESTSFRDQTRPPSANASVRAPIVTSEANSLTLARPPSASFYVHRRMSTDSSINCRSLSSQTKSISQPQSPEFHPRRASLPVSPCRLPMKKRKLNWSQLDSDALLCSPATPSDLNQCTSSSCSSFDFSFLNVPKSPATAATVGNISDVTSSLTPSLRSSQPSPYLSLPSHSPLIINCSPDYPSSSLSRTNHRNNPIIATSSMPSTSSFEDRRPRSIPAPLTSTQITSGGLAAKKLEKNDVSNSASNISQGTGTLHNLFVSTRSPVVRPPTNTKNCAEYSKRSSLLIRSLPTTTSHPTQVNRINDCLHSIVAPSSEEVANLVRSQSSFIDSMKRRHSMDFSKSSSYQHQPYNGFSSAKPNTTAVSNQLNGPTSVLSSVFSPSNKHPVFGRTRSVMAIDHNPSSLAAEQANTNTQVSSAISGNTTCTTDRPVAKQRTGFDSVPDLPQLMRRWLEMAENTTPSDATSSCVKSSEDPVNSPLLCAPLTNHNTKFEPTLVLSSNPESERQGLSSTDTPHNAQIIMMLSPADVTPTLDSSKLTAADDVISLADQRISKLDSVVRLGSMKSSFPLFLVSASSSAGAAALAAATARATGAPPSSLVPVPVQISYVPTSSIAAKTDSSQQTVSLLSSITASSKCDDRSPLEPPEQRHLISLSTSVTNGKRGNDPQPPQCKTPLLYDASCLIGSLDNKLLDSSNIELVVGSKNTGGIALSYPPTAVAHPSA